MLQATNKQLQYEPIYQAHNSSTIQIKTDKAFSCNKKNVLTKIQWFK